VTLNLHILFRLNFSRSIKIVMYRLMNKRLNTENPIEKTLHVSIWCLFHCESDKNYRLYGFSSRGHLFKSVKLLLLVSAVSSNLLLFIFFIGVEQWYSTFFLPVPLETLLHSTLYPQSCWCKISFLSRVGNARNRKQYKFTLERNVTL
jgi:hypothetical protein